MAAPTPMTTDIRQGLTARWQPSPTTLRLARRTDRCCSLGPGTRAVLWVQGCCFRCPGCVAPETLPFQGGVPSAVEDLAWEILALDDIEGVTFSGGEPFMQAAPLATLIDLIKTQRPLSFMSYTGFTLAELQSAGDSEQLNLLARLDLLIDGRYRRDQHTTLLWRGSRNQQVHFLSDRYTHLRNRVDRPTVSIDVTIEADGSFSWAGIPPQGFRQAVEQNMKNRGVSFEAGEGVL